MSLWLVVVLTVVVVGTVLPAVFSVAQALLGSALGANPTLVSINRGPKVGEFAVRGTCVALRLLPLGSFVKFGEEEDDSLRRRPLLVQLVVILVGPASLLLLAAACLGVDAWRAFVHGFWQVPYGAAQPLSVGAGYVTRFFALISDHPVTALGIASAKLSAGNMLPIPSLAGFEVLRRLATGGAPERMRGAWLGYGALAGLLIFAGWLVAIARVLLQGR